MRLSRALSFLMLTLATPLAFAAAKAPKVPQTPTNCIECHTKVSPGIVEQFKDGLMFKKGVDCSNCHGLDHKEMGDAKNVKMPTPETCNECHEDQVAQFKAGKHDLAWLAAANMPMWGHQPAAIVGEGYKGCAGCHKIGAKSAEEQKKFHYGNAQCDACHTRHSFKKSEAKDPRACQTCHMGFDHPQWEMYSTSKHGTIWAIEGKDTKRGATCQTCHMPDGNHAVMTSWGFLALRLPEEDKEWWADRVTILQALGVVDDAGKMTERVKLVVAGKVARLTKEEFDKPRAEMLKVCANCHGESYAKQQLDAGDQVVKEIDKLMAAAIREVQGLYKDGILKKPEGWTHAPDLLQFYENKTPAEVEMHVMFLEYRMRAFQGAFHMNPDYMHWYGWAPMKESLTKIKDEVARMRAEHKAAPAKAAQAGAAGTVAAGR